MQGRVDQASTAGSLMIGSSLKGAIVSQAHVPILALQPFVTEGPNGRSCSLSADPLRSAPERIQNLTFAFGGRKAGERPKGVMELPTYVAPLSRGLAVNPRKSLKHKENACCRLQHEL